MDRELTARSSLETLRKEAKRWLKALRANDRDARARFDRAWPSGSAPVQPVLRDVQHALALEHGAGGWAELLAMPGDRQSQPSGKRAEVVAELLVAAAGGDVSRVKSLLAADPTLLDERGGAGTRTALHVAILSNHGEVARQLLEHGADPNIRCEGDNATPLHFACEKGSLSMIRDLVEHGASVNVDGDVHELGILGWATCFGPGDPTVVEYLLSRGARHNIFSAVAVGDGVEVSRLANEDPARLHQHMDRANQRRTVLHLAVEKKQARALAILLEAGAGPDATDASGLTALDRAALQGNDELVAMLEKGGATLHLPAAIALDRAADVERLSLALPGALRPHQRYGSLLLRASERCGAQVIRALIRGGASINEPDVSETSVDGTLGYTPLHAAAFHGNVEAVRELLTHGASVSARDSTYVGTPAAWAHHAKHIAVRDIVLSGQIDLFDAIAFDLPERVPGILARDPLALERPFGDYVHGESRPDQWWQPWWTPLAHAIANGKMDAVNALLQKGANPRLKSPDGQGLADLTSADTRAEVVRLLQLEASGGDVRSQRRAEFVARFVANACPDHHVRGANAHDMARFTASQQLRQHPDLVRDSLYTAIACGDLAEVTRLVGERHAVVREKDGPKNWEPLLYLCFSRAPIASASSNAVTIARLLLDHGADPNAYFDAGDSKYTPLVGVIGEGEEDRPPHPQVRALTRLLLERGANPFDEQVIYNTHFHGMQPWLLELMYEVSVGTELEVAWKDPHWAMLDMGGYGNGARFLLSQAMERDNVALMKWMLEHGADPNAPPPRDRRMSKRSLHAEAVGRGFAQMAKLLERFGAMSEDAAMSPTDAFVAASLQLDRERVGALLKDHPELLKSPHPLHAAARYNRADVATFLLDLGASPDVEDPAQGRQRPLHVAAAHDAVQVAEVLIARGAEVDARESRWEAAPFGFAVYAKQQRMIALLGSLTRDVFNLVYVGNVARLRELLTEDNSLARLVRDGETPLFVLPNDDEVAIEIVQLFLAHGANAAQRDGRGRSASEIASERGLQGAGQLLAEREGTT